jgi:hypothetical protein
MAEVEESAGSVHCDAIDQDFRIPALSTAKEKRVDRSNGSVLHQYRSGHIAKNVGYASDPFRANLFTGDYRHRLSERCF